MTVVSRFAAWFTATTISLLLTFVSTTGHAQESPASPSEPGSSLQVSLLTFGPGEIYWERFGHNAIRIRDTVRGGDVAYNYGMFDFGEDDFLLNFARGRMQYRIVADYTDEDLPLYAEEGRWTVEQHLNLLPAQRLALRDFLEWNRRPENALYRYDYFTSNCSTRVRDALDKALGGAIHDQFVAPSKGFTYRMHADRLMRPDVMVLLGIDAGLGPFADKRLSFWDESFVPMEFMTHLREVKVRNAAGDSVPLVAQETVLTKAVLPDPPNFPSDLRWPFGAIGLALALVLLWLAARRQSAAARWTFSVVSIALSLVCVVGGLTLAALWTLTEHQSAWRNENLLLLNPLCLLLLPTWWRARRSQWRITAFGRTVVHLVFVCAALALFVKILPAWFVQDNRAWIALLLPLHAALCLAVRRRSA